MELKDVEDKIIDWLIKKKKIKGQLTKQLQMCTAHSHLCGRFQKQIFLIYVKTDYI